PRPHAPERNVAQWSNFALFVRPSICRLSRRFRALRDRRKALLEWMPGPSQQLQRPTGESLRLGPIRARCSDLRLTHLRFAAPSGKSLAYHARPRRPKKQLLLFQAE